MTKQCNALWIVRPAILPSTDNYAMISSRLSHGLRKTLRCCYWQPLGTLLRSLRHDFDYCECATIKPNECN